MPSAAAYTNRLRFAASVKNTKAQMPGNVGNLAQTAAAGCGLTPDYSRLTYTENQRCVCSVKYKAPEDWYITTIAGTSAVGYSGDGGPATLATFNYPEALDVDSEGNIYIADSGNNCIRKMDRAGIITTIAGTGVAGYSGDGDLATLATLNYPTGVKVVANGDIYITDNTNHRIRKVQKSTGIITTVAGTGVPGYSGDGGLAVNADMLYPRGRVIFDSVGNTYIADSNNFRIRKVDTSGTITTFAGTGVEGYSGDGEPAIDAHISFVFDLDIDSLGHIYISDNGNGRIRKIDSTGIMTSIAETSGEGGVSVGTNGIIYIIEGVSGYRIEQINRSGIITTFAGTGVEGYSGDGGLAINADMRPFRLATDSATIYVADAGNNVIRKIYRAQ